VKQENIELSGICTSCHTDEFYSERKLGRPTGRFGALLSLRRR
jgi:copper oxidase (laccase) domain-containing protein